MCHCEHFTPSGEEIQCPFALKLIFRRKSFYRCALRRASSPEPAAFQRGPLSRAEAPGTPCLPWSPRGESASHREPRWPRGQHVGGKDIWSVGCQGDNFPPPLVLPLGMQASWKLGAQASWGVIAKQGRHSAGDAAQPGSSVGCECGSREAGPCSPTLGLGAVWALALIVPCIATRRPYRLHRHTFLSCIWLAGIQLPPTKLGPACPLAPACPHTEGYGARMC